MSDETNYYVSWYFFAGNFAYLTDFIIELNGLTYEGKLSSKILYKLLRSIK